MLSIYEAEKLEIAKKLLEEVEASEGFKATDYHPDLHLGDALQAINELLSEYYPEGYTPPETISEGLCHIRPWHEKLRDRISFGFGEFITTTLMVAMLSACASIICWGLSDAKAAFGGNKIQPDFAAHFKMYKEIALASFGLSIGASVLASSVSRNKEF